MDDQNEFDQINFVRKLRPKLIHQIDPSLHRSKVSHSFSVPLNLFSIAKSDQLANPPPGLDQASMTAAQ
jgi:hypothetical protein